MTCARSHALVAAFLATASLCASAQAPLFRAYLSVKGSDASPCTLAAPCRLLQRALEVVDITGEVWMLDSGNYNTQEVGIDKAVTIVSMPGVQGSLVATPNGTAVTVVTPTNVTFRNVTFLPLPGSGATVGVVKSGAGTLTLQDCNVVGFSLTGVSVGGGANLAVIRSVFRDNEVGVAIDSNGSVGVSDSTFSANPVAISSNVGSTSIVRILVSRSVIRLAARGINANANVAGAKVTVHVADSHLEGFPTPGPTASGVSAVAVAGAIAEISVSGSYVSRYNRGIWLSGPAPSTGTLSGNHVTGNGVGLLVEQAPSAVNSAGNNLIRNNGQDVSTTIAITTGAQ